ncbi:hypothetical protein ABBQ32_011731 [Trebouxia sp. C0010 RCD-2024]
MLSLLFKPGRLSSPFQLVRVELQQSSSFQLRNLRVPYIQPEDCRQSLKSSGSRSGQNRSKDWQSAPATTLAFDPSCAEEGVLRSINQQARPDTGDAVPSSSPGSLSFDPSSGSAPLEAEHGPSTSGSNMPFTPRSDDIKLLGKMLRSDLAAEMAAVGLFKGRRLVSPGNRPDLDFFKDQEKGHLQQLQSLMPTYRARPSLLGPLAAAAGFSLGAAAGVLPTRFAHAITAATQEALVEQYNDQLRELREAGLTEQAEEVREALRALRDEERAPEASVQVPDIMSLQSPQDLKLEEGVAAVVKFGLGNLFSIAAKV